MKLSTRDASGYFAKPDPTKAGILIYGVDAMRVADKRQQLLAALLGQNAEEEMRLTRMSGAELRKEPALLLDAVKAVGFFPGPRAAFVEEAGDAALKAVEAALAEWAPGDAQVVVTAGALKASSKLRKLFEGHKNAFAVGIYDDPPTRDEIERVLQKAGVQAVSSGAMSALSELAGSLGPGDFSQTVEKIALYKMGDATELSPEEVEISAPATSEAALDDILNLVAEGHTHQIGPTLARLQAQGTNAVGLCIGATRHFRMLFAITADPDGPAAGIGKLRPPVFGKRRDRLLRQAQEWGPHRLEDALTLLTDADLQLRSAAQTAPAMALVERALIRLSMLKKAR